jgi:hypothetical protein
MSYLLGLGTGCITELETRSSYDLSASWERLLSDKAVVKGYYNEAIPSSIIVLHEFE